MKLAYHDVWVYYPNENRTELQTRLVKVISPTYAIWNDYMHDRWDDYPFLVIHLPSHRWICRCASSGDAEAVIEALVEAGLELDHIHYNIELTSEERAAGRFVGDQLRSDGVDFVW